MANEAPDFDSFCLPTNIPDESPVIRFVGGIAIEPQIDPTRGGGGAGPCGLTVNMVGPLQAALAPFQPFLTLLDTVATLAQCTLLVGEVVTNPFKIPDLLACIPGLVGKINTLLQLIPVFPQGIQAFITFIVDVIRFVATQIDCLIEVLGGLQNALDQLGDIADKINNVDDVTIKGQLQKLFDCSNDDIQESLSLQLSVLGPVARILCAVRAQLALIPKPKTPVFPPGASIDVFGTKISLPPSGKDIQCLLRFPDPSNISILEDAITALKILRDALLATEDVLIILTAGLGALPPPDVGFKCPLDDLCESSEPEEEPIDPPKPNITSITTSGGLSIPPATIPIGSDFDVLINGLDLNPPDAEQTTENKVFFGTSPIPADNIQIIGEVQLLVTIPSELLQNSGEFFVSVVNERIGGGASGPFQGLDGSSVGGDNNAGEGVAVSDPFQVTVS